MCLTQRALGVQEYTDRLADLPDYLTCDCALKPHHPVAGECRNPECVAGINWHALEAFLPALRRLETGHMTSALDGFAALGGDDPFGFSDDDDGDDGSAPVLPLPSGRQRSDGSGFSGFTTDSDARSGGAGARRGYALDYYVNKFKVGDDEVAAKAAEVTTHYTVALAWVFQYYCHGCAR